MKAFFYKHIAPDGARLIESSAPVFIDFTRRIDNQILRQCWLGTLTSAESSK